MAVEIATKQDLVEMFQVLSSQLAEIQRELGQGKGNLSKKEAAKLLGLSEKSLDRLKDAGKIGFEQHGRRIVFPMNKLIAYKNSKAV